MGKKLKRCKKSFRGFKCFRDEETERRRDEETKRQRDEETERKSDYVQASYYHVVNETIN